MPIPIRTSPNSFYIDHNQNPNFLDLSYLMLKPGHPSVNATAWMLVEFDYLTGSGGYYATPSYVSSNTEQQLDTDSLPLSGLTSTMNTFEVPEVYGPKGDYYDLLNQYDFRPSAANTVAPASTAAGAPVNPPETLSFGNTADPANDKKFPSPDTNLTANVSQWLGRKDSVCVGSDGNIFILRGEAAIDPRRMLAPNQPKSSLKINELVIPPYPNLPVHMSEEMSDIVENRVANERYSYQRLSDKVVATSLSPVASDRLQPKGYTMADIGNLERRIQSLEYYVALSILETDIKDRVIPSSIDRSLSLRTG